MSPADTSLGPVVTILTGVTTDRKLGFYMGKRRLFRRPANEPLEAFFNNKVFCDGFTTE